MQLSLSYNDGYSCNLICSPLCLVRPVIVEIPHFGSMRGQERELIILRSENGESWKEHMYDCRTDDLVQLLAGMDEGSLALCVCRLIVTSLTESDHCG